MYNLSSRNACAMGAIRHGPALSKRRGWSKGRRSCHAGTALNMFSMGDWGKAERLARWTLVCPSSTCKPIERRLALTPLWKQK
jgi:hypothetical protein